MRSSLRERRPKRVRVLIIIQNGPLERDARVQRQCLSLLSAGLDVTVVCPNERGDTVPPALESVRHLSYPKPREASSAIGYVFEYSYCLAMTWLLVTWAAISGGFDLIQCCSPPDLLWTIAAPFRLFRKSYVFDHHDLSPELFEARFGRRGPMHTALQTAEKAAVALADHVIETNSTALGIVASRTAVPTGRFTVVRNGPTLAEIRSSTPRPELKQGRPWLCCWHGIMGMGDGVDLAIRAAGIVINDVGRDDCTFAFAGDGELRGQAEALVDELGIRDFVTFPGWLRRDTVFDYLATADIGLAPDPSGMHLDWSTSIKAIEYMGLGVPVVGFELQELMDSVGDAGVFVPDNSPAHMAAAIDLLLSDPDRRRHLGKTGRELVETQLSWDRQAENYVDRFQQILSDKSGNSS